MSYEYYILAPVTALMYMYLDVSTLNCVKLRNTQCYIYFLLLLFLCNVNVFDFLIGKKLGGYYNASTGILLKKIIFFYEQQTV